MRLNENIDLGYCTNVHRGETWEETFASLQNATIAVKDRVCPGGPYGIGLRLSHAAARELAEGSNLIEFEQWLDRNHCYVFTINGFPYGKFHGTRVKEQVYVPDWTSSDRLEYTNLLFSLLSELLPEGRQGSVSTLPGSFKEFLGVGEDGISFDEFIAGDDPRLEAMCHSIRMCAHHVTELRERTGQDLHLGLEPEPLGFFETSRETVAFFDRLTKGVPNSESLLKVVGVNYDTCHLAVEYEEPGEALGRLVDAGIRISKVHLSSALSLAPEEKALARLRSFQEDTYLHQVVVRASGKELRRFRDLPEAFAFAGENPGEVGEEWRVHFHIPLYAGPAGEFMDTRSHIEGTLAYLAEHPDVCKHLEMETYTWEVLPEEMHAESVVDQLAREYEWCLAALGKVKLYE